MKPSIKRCIKRPSKLAEEERADQRDLCKQWIARRKDPDWFDVKVVNKTVGKGLFAKRGFQRGDFIIEYNGELIAEEEAYRREKKYPLSLGSFLFFFKHKSKRLCVDATFSNRKGKYINDAFGADKNSEMLKIVVSGNPHLCVFATKNIQSGEEIRYDYGVPGLPWREPKREPFLTLTKEKEILDERSCLRDIRKGQRHASDLHRKYPKLKGCSVVLGRRLTEDLLSQKKQSYEQDNHRAPSQPEHSLDVLERRNDKFQHFHDNTKQKQSCEQDDPTTSPQPDYSIDVLAPSKSIHNLACIQLDRNQQPKPSVDFLKAFVPVSVVDMAINYSCCIEEGDIETVPENVHLDSLTNVNDELLSSIKKYFTEDAWMCLTNTLEVILAQKKQSCEQDDPTTSPQPDYSIDVLDKRNDNNQHFQDSIPSKAMCNPPDFHQEQIKLLQSSIDFLKAFVPESVVDMAINYSCCIDENDIETVPENVQLDSLTNVNDELLSSIKKYFTEDAWMCLTNTLEVILARTTEFNNKSADMSREEHNLHQLSTNISNAGPSSSSELPGVRLKDFLHIFSSKSSVELAIQNHVLIERDELIDLPKSMPFDMSTNIDNSLLSTAEQYFTRDAWFCIQSILKSSKEKANETETPTVFDGDNGATRGQSEECVEKYKKPHRPCPFCKRLMSKLRKHLERKHKDEPEVKAALTLHKHDRDLAFDALRKKGILKFNMAIMTEKNRSTQKLQRERHQETKKSELTYCSKCYAFVSKALFYRHRSLCYMANNSTTVPIKIHPSIHLCPGEPGLYEKEILATFHNDEVGLLCRSDPLIASYGRREFKKVSIQTDKKDEKRKTLKGDMRRLARLYIAFKAHCKEAKVITDSAMDMFNRINFKILEESILQISSGDDRNTTKDGFKIGIGYLLKKVAKYIYGSLLERKEDNKANEITRFLDLLNFHWINIFSQSEYSVKKARQSVLRKPIHLPLENDIQLLRNFTFNKIKDLTHDTYNFITQKDYIFLRDLLVCRLTLFNARRGGEPSRLKIEEWKDADQNVWQQHVIPEEIEDPLEQKLFERFKLAYQPGKTGKLVPLLIIDDCWKGMCTMVDTEIRIRVGVGKENKYVFPYTQGSNHHALGWQAVNKCSSLAGCSKAINATHRRHHVATLYAAHEVPKEERAGFLLHMDHSENINLNVYQSPPALTEITKVGRFLLRLDDTRDDNTRPLPKRPRLERTLEPMASPISSGNTNGEKTSDRLSDARSNTDNKSGRSPQSSGDDNTRPLSKRPRLERTLEPMAAPISSDYDESGEEFLPNESSENSSSDIAEENDSPFDSKSKDVPFSTPKKVKRQIHRWDGIHTSVIREYFKEFIYSTDNLGSNKGNLPGLRGVRTFLNIHPEILQGESESVRIGKVKAKIFNERKTIRQKLKDT